MSISHIANQASSAKNLNSLGYVWFRASANDDVSTKNYKFLNEMENAGRQGGAKVIAITVPYSPKQELEDVAVVYAMFKGSFNEEQRELVNIYGAEIDAATYNKDNALLSHLNGYNDEVDTTIDMDAKPSSYHAFDGLNLRNHKLNQNQRMLSDLHEAPSTLQ